MASHQRPNAAASTPRVFQSLARGQPRGQMQRPRCACRRRRGAWCGGGISVAAGGHACVSYFDVGVSSLLARVVYGLSVWVSFAGSASRRLSFALSQTSALPHHSYRFPHTPPPTPVFPCALSLSLSGPRAAAAALGLAPCLLQLQQRLCSTPVLSRAPPLAAWRAHMASSSPGGGRRARMLHRGLVLRHARTSHVARLMLLCWTRHVCQNMPQMHARSRPLLLPHVLLRLRLTSAPLSLCTPMSPLPSLNAFVRMHACASVPRCLYTLF